MEGLFLQKRNVHDVGKTDEKYVASRRDTERKVHTLHRTVGVEENKSKINQRNTWCCSCS